MTRRSTPRATPGSVKASRTPAADRPTEDQPAEPQTAKGAGERGGAGQKKPVTPKARQKARRRPAPRPQATRVIAVANQKGGVGKSTSAVSIGAALAEIGYKVLVVDLDPQGNASTGLGIRHEARDITVYDVLAAEAPIDGAVVPTPVPGLFAIPSTIDLAGAEIELVSQFSRELRLRKALEPLRQSGYDFVFLDCPPSLGLLTVNALAAAEELIVPIQCEYYALEGLGQLLRNVGLVQQNVNPSLRLTGIVMTMYDPRTKLSEQVVAEVRRYFGARVYRTVIPRTVRLSEAPGFGQPITVYDPRSRGAECYRELAREVARRLPTDEPLPSFEDLAKAIAPPEPEPVSAPHPLRREEESEVPVGDAGGAMPEPSEPFEPPQPAEEEAEPSTTGDLARSQEEPEVETAAELTEPGLDRVVVAPASPEPEVETPVAAVGPEAPPAEAVASVDIGGPSSAEASALSVEETSTEAAPPAEEALRVSEVAPAEPDADGAEEWIATVEAQARSEGETPVPPVEPSVVREIDLEPEPEGTAAMDPTEVIRIKDRDAAGDHEPATEGTTEESAHGRGKLRWSLFRRGGSR